MNDDTLRKLQLTELEMLQDVADFCEKNNIDYFLTGGTLLGAVRHGGFIPWDDDIDIGMDLKNYKKFLKMAPKGLPDKYFVQHFTTDPKVSIPWIKVRINGTTSMERHMTNYDIHYGICMDIFLFNGISERKRKRESQEKYAKEMRTWLLKWRYIEGDVQNWNTKKIRRCPEFLRRILIRLYDNIINVDLNKTKYCYDNYFDDIGKTCRFKSSWFHSLTKIKFENTLFYAPSEFEEYLLARYGDWKTLPPEKERVNHGDIIVDFENDYTMYRRDQKR